MALDLSTIRTVLFDMDGVLYRGDQVLPGVDELWRWLEAHNVQYACITNNASRTPAQFAQKLAGMGLAVSPERIITSSLSTNLWLRERAPRGTAAYAVGMDGLREALFGDGYFVEQSEHPAYVVVGADFEVTYAKLRTACLAIRAGAQFIGTNPDKTFPSEEGIVPGCGALLAALQAATDIEPVVIGKPERAMFDTAISLLGADAETTLMVGDRIDTDIDGARRAGLRTAMVLTGVSSAADAASHTPPPDGVWDDLPALLAAWEHSAPARGTAG